MGAGHCPVPVFPSCGLRNMRKNDISGAFMRQKRCPAHIAGHPRACVLPCIRRTVERALPLKQKMGAQHRQRHLQAKGMACIFPLCIHWNLKWNCEQKSPWDMAPMGFFIPSAQAPSQKAFPLQACGAGQRSVRLFGLRRPALRGRAGPGFVAARQKGRKRIGESGAAFKGNEKTFRRICKIFAPNIVNFTNTILK